MTLAEMVQECKDRMAEQSDAFFDPSMWKRWLNEAQRTVVRQTKILERTAKTTVFPGISVYPMAKDFWVVRLVKLDDHVIYPESVDDMEVKLPTTGRPYRYTIWGGSLHLTPIPSSTYTLFVRYYAWPSEMKEDEDEPEIPEAFHSLLPTFAVYRARQIDGNLAEADRLYAEFNNGVLQLLEALSEPQEQATRVRDVVTDFDWRY